MSELYTYSGLRSLLLPKHLPLTHGRLARTKEEMNNLTSIISGFKGTDVVLIYFNPDTEKYSGTLHDNYTGCTFARGILHGIDFPEVKLYSGNKENASVNAGLLLDFISVDAVTSDFLSAIKNFNAPLKFFNFTSTNPHEPSDLYEILHRDPVSAFIGREQGDDPLYLASIHSLAPGMQFNTYAKRE